MKVTVLTVGPVYTNCYIVNKKDSNGCVVIDPGEEAEKIASYVRKNQLICEGILLTHGHFDHITAVNELHSLVGGRVYAYEGEKDLMADPVKNSSDLLGYEVTVQADEWLRDGQLLEVADMIFRVMHTPGHTRGSCCYYAEKEKILFSGDTIFMESVGRTDLPTGNDRELLDSIRNKVLVLPDDVVIYPGHGPKTRVDYEIANNPYA